MTTITIDRAKVDQAVAILHKHHQFQTRYSRAKRAANATCADFRTSPIAELAEAAYMDGIGKETEMLLETLRAALAAPATAPEFPADWAQMIHYPECWDTAAYPELRDAIHEALAWSGCSVCKPAQPERKPMTKGQREQVARRAEAAMNGNVNLSWRDALMSETEAFHDIKETP